MPYKVEKIGKAYRIKAHGKALKGHFKTKKSAMKVTRYLYAKGY